MPGEREKSMRKGPCIWHKSRMLTIYVLAAFVLTATSAVAVEHPVVTRRFSRSHGDGGVHVNVKPKFLTMKRGMELKFTCRVKSGIRVEDTPFVSFFRRLNENTVMPLGSASYGVSIRNTHEHSNSVHARFQKSVKILKLERQTYDVLNYGENVFYCKGFSLKGKSSAAFFVVRKV